jgi:ABC-type Na+ efflux pump permease subunit
LKSGNLELLINTPIKTPELMLGKILPYILIGLIQLVLVLGLGWYFFEVPIRGSLIHVLAAALVFIAANLSLGLLVSTVAATQSQGNADGFLLFFTFYSDLGLYVSLRWHASCRSESRRDSTAHPFQSTDPWHRFAGRRHYLDAG